MCLEVASGVVCQSDLVDEVKVGCELSDFMVMFFDGDFGFPNVVDSGVVWFGREIVGQLPDGKSFMG